MSKLHELDRPLDVGQSAQTQFEVRLRIGTTWQAFGLHPGLEHADLPYRVRRHSALRPPDRVDQVSKGPPQISVTCHRGSAQQGLSLPGKRPALVVGGEATKRTHHRAPLAFRTKICVDDQLWVRTRDPQ